MTFVPVSKWKGSISSVESFEHLLDDDEKILARDGVYFPSPETIAEQCAEIRELNAFMNINRSAIDDEPEYVSPRRPVSIHVTNEKSEPSICDCPYWMHEGI